MRKDLFPEEGVKLATDFEQSIDEIVNQKLQATNGLPRPRHRRHDAHNGRPPSHAKKKKKKSSRPRVKGGKNLSLVSSTECQEDTSEDEVLSVKLPVTVVRQSGKPYSHKLSQLSSKKSKSKDFRERKCHVVVPSSGKPRSMLDICSSRSKKKSKKTESTSTYKSQIVDSTTFKIKIRRTSNNETVSITCTIACFMMNFPLSVHFSVLLVT